MGSWLYRNELISGQCLSQIELSGGMAEDRR